MGILDSARREFIARPDEFKDRIVFKWPDENIRRQTRLTVEADEQAVFFKGGQVAGWIGPGVAPLDGSDIPFLGNLVDQATGGNFLRSELYFVSTREFPNLLFGGLVDNVLDPQTQLGVGLRVFGDYSLRVANPPALITNLAGTEDLSDNSRVTDWARDQLLKAFRENVVAHVTSDGWPILGLAAHSAQIEAETLARVQGAVTPYGLQVVRLGNFTISLKPEDEETLKKYLEQAQYTKLAGGSLQQAAAAEALEGLGEGAAKGGEASGAAELGMGLAAARLMATLAGPPAPAPAPPAQPAAAARFCTHCGRQAAADDRFCAGCGAALPGA